MEFVDQETLDGLLRHVVGLSISSTSIDPKVWCVQNLMINLGEKAVEAMLLGLSRPFKPTSEDTELLISQWERRDQGCCFTGSVQDLLSLSETIIVALSYKHDFKENWGRKGKNLISKMTQTDQEELIQSVLGLGTFPKTSTLMVWCDQILSSRLGNGKRNIFGWHNAGLLPYLCLPVLTMSTYFPEADLERRLWIKVERSLGRLGNGLLSISDAKRGLPFHLLSHLTPWDVLQNISLLILSGFWPEDTGFWANDYNDMKTWALGLICRSDKIIALQVHDKLRPVDNIEVLANLHALSMVPQGFEQKERPCYTTDPLFFLKATAWNLSLDEVWKKDSACISHYLGRSVLYIFSWWIERKSQAICGFFVSTERACFVLAIKDGLGYKVFRRGVDPVKYRHKATKLDSEMKSFITETAGYFGVYVDVQPEWSLLFFCDECIDTHMTDTEVKQLIENMDAHADALVPYQFVGQTTSIYRVAGFLRRMQCNSGLSGASFLSLFDEWNSHVKKTYNNWICVRDTRSGPPWLEGYNEECVSFGFLDFMTRSLIAGQKSMSERIIHLPSKWEALQEIRRAASVAKNDLKVIAEEIFGRITEDTCEEHLTSRDLARLMVSGGFTSGFGNDRLTSFLTRSAHSRGYWTTDVHCKGGKMQILFFHDCGDLRIIQREAKLEEFLAVGIVHPEDSDFVFDLADKLDEHPDMYRGYKYWRDKMTDNTTKKEMELAFRYSRGSIRSHFVSTVDMTVGRQLGVDTYSVHDATRDDPLNPKQYEQTETAKKILSTVPQEKHTEIMTKFNNLLCEEVGSGFEKLQASHMQRKKKVQDAATEARTMMENLKLEHQAQEDEEKKEESRPA